MRLRAVRACAPILRADRVFSWVVFDVVVQFVVVECYKKFRAKKLMPLFWVDYDLKFLMRRILTFSIPLLQLQKIKKRRRKKMCGSKQKILYICLFLEYWNAEIELNFFVLEEKWK